MDHFTFFGHLKMLFHVMLFVFAVIGIVIIVKSFNGQN